MKLLMYLINRYRYWRMRHLPLDEMLLTDIVTHRSYLHARHEWELAKRFLEVEERKARK